MTTKGFIASHSKDAVFERGLRSFFEYRDLGIKNATEGRQRQATRPAVVARLTRTFYLAGEVKFVGLIDNNSNVLS